MWCTFIGAYGIFNQASERGMLPRPGLVGEMNANVPLRIKRDCD